MINPFDYLSSNYKKAVFRLIKHLALNSKKWSRNDLLKEVEKNIIDLYYDESCPYPTCLFMGIDEARRISDKIIYDLYNSIFENTEIAVVSRKQFLNNYKESSFFRNNIDIEKYLVNENYIRKS